MPSRSSGCPKDGSPKAASGGEASSDLDPPRCPLRVFAPRDDRPRDPLEHFVPALRRGRVYPPWEWTGNTQRKGALLLSLRVVELQQRQHFGIVLPAELLTELGRRIGALAAVVVQGDIEELVVDARAAAVVAGGAGQTCSTGWFVVSRFATDSFPSPSLLKCDGLDPITVA